MEIGLISSNLSIESNTLSANPQENLNGQTKFSELMLSKLNQSENVKICKGFPAETSENVSLDMEEFLSLYDGSMMNCINSSESSKAIAGLFIQSPITVTEQQEASGNKLGVVMQDNTVIQPQSQTGTGELLLNPALGGQPAQSNSPENQALHNQIAHVVMESKIANRMPAVTNQAVINPEIIDPEMINNPGVASNPEPANAKQQTGVPNISGMVKSETAQLENIGNANKNVQTQGLSEKVIEPELNHMAAALKGVTGAIENNSTAIQNEQINATAKAQPYNQIEKAITETLQNQGPKEFSLQLKPESLGVIDIKLKLEAGKMTIDIAAASAKTQALLAGQVDKLIQGLGLNIQNVQIENVHVSRQEAEPSSQLQNQSFTANENSNMFQRRQQQQTHAEHNTNTGEQSILQIEPDLNSKLSFNEGAKYRLNYSV
ncbi:MAG: flagellar hook-length control protein FliK [Eubacteriales bacterium]|nr:flagellar hook-length control protein FliK [Eubacteriales bacterium]MDD4390129.1 flagellar hook-length control protein FliK [Eubacteriales bacterium]